MNTQNVPPFCKNPGENTVWMDVSVYVCECITVCVCVCALCVRTHLFVLLHANLENMLNSSYCYIYAPCNVLMSR